MLMLMKLLFTKKKIINEIEEAIPFKEVYMKAYIEYAEQLRISKLEKMLDSDSSEVPIHEEK
jgi:hypothetical protein